jgi:5-(carboxyamino)imidazole ribonucleotide synthase
MGLPPVHPVSKSFAVMANLLGQSQAGDHREALAAAMEVPGTFVHWYGKQESRPGRKMGHLNLVPSQRESVESVVGKAIKAREAFYAAWRRP